VLNRKLSAALAAMIAVLGTALVAAPPSALAAGQPAGYPHAPQSGGFFAFDNIAASRTGIWVFVGAGTSGPGSIKELSPSTGRPVRTLRERTPGQIPWVVAAYGNHLWTTVVPADGVPALATVTAAGAFAHLVNLAYTVSPEGPIAGPATLAGSQLWAVTGSSRGRPAGLLEVSASTGARTRSLPWPRALRGFSPQGMTVDGGRIWITDGGCQIARVTISSDLGRIFRLPPRDCQITSTPAQISVSGDDVWVAADASATDDLGSLAEVNAANGRLVRIVSGRTYGWEFPTFLTAGPDLWVTNATGGFHGNGSVTEFSASTGRLMHYFSGRQYHFDQPWSIAAWGSHVWILNINSVTRLS
jgi:hypothetical protein